MTKQQAELLDYEYNTQAYERRIESLLNSIWEEYAIKGCVTMRNYIIAVSYE